MPWIRNAKNGCILDLQIQPQSRKNEIVGLYNQRLKVKIQSPPVDGKANQALIEFITDVLNLNRSSVSILKGESSRKKQLYISGISADVARPLLMKRTTS